jgi:hypothetical protein
MNIINFTGNKIGDLVGVDKGNIETSIVHIINEYRPNGPAENSILLINKMANGLTYASYIPWVGYFDLDKENLCFGNKWKIIEPYEVENYQDIIWKPFENSES